MIWDHNFIKTTCHWKFINFFLDIFFDSRCWICQRWNEQKNNKRKIFRCFHCVKHELHLYRNFNSFFLYLFFETSEIKCFIETFTYIAFLLRCIFLMKIFCRAMLVRIICATLFNFTNINLMFIFLTLYALLNSTVLFIIFYCFHV